MNLKCCVIFGLKSLQSMCSYVVAAGDKLLRDRAPAASSIGFSVHGHLLRCPLLRYARPFCFRDTISPFTFYVHCTNINSSPDLYLVAKTTSFVYICACFANTFLVNLDLHHGAIQEEERCNVHYFLHRYGSFVKYLQL